MAEKQMEGVRRWAEIKGYNEGLNDGWIDAVDEAIETVREALQNGHDPLMALLDLGIKINEKGTEIK
jgi:hypothetical protein